MATSQPAPSARSWVPRSWAAPAVFLSLAVVVILPALMSFFLAYLLYTGCFLECTRPGHGQALVCGGRITVFIPLFWW